MIKTSEDPQVVEIPLDRLTVSKLNVRRELGDISELVESIKAVGVLQPILVRPSGKNSFEVVVGSRRFAASKKANLKTIPAIVREMTDDQAIVESLTENIQRGDLEIEEVAEAYLSIRKLDPKRWTQEAFAKETGKSQNWLSSIIEAYQLLIKLRKVGKQYKIDIHPTEEEQEKGILPWTILTEVNYALKSEEVRKLPEDKINKAMVELVESIKGETREDVKRILNVFKMYPEKPIEEIKEMALARKTGIELKASIPAGIMRKVEESAKQIGKPVDIIIPTVLEKGIEAEVKKVEVERLLEKSPKYVAEAARRMEQTMTPKVISKILELPEERREEATRFIEAFRFSEEEALHYIESTTIEGPSPIPKSEIEAIKKRHEELTKELEAISEKPEVKERRQLARNWHSHYIIFQGVSEAFCPVCGREKSGELVWGCCGLPVKDALNVARESFERSQKKKSD